MTISVNLRLRLIQYRNPMEEFKNYINGKWIDSTSKQFVDVLSPSDNKVFAKIQNSNSEDVDNAVNSARIAFESGEWSKLTAVDRGRLLCKFPMRS